MTVDQLSDTMPYDTMVMASIHSLTSRSWILVQWHQRDKWTDGRTDIQTAMYMSPPCIRTGVLKNYTPIWTIFLKSYPKGDFDTKTVRSQTVQNGVFHLKKKHVSLKGEHIVACHLPRAPSYGGARTWVEGSQMRGDRALAGAIKLPTTRLNTRPTNYWSLSH